MMQFYRQYKQKSVDYDKHKSNLDFCIHGHQSKHGLHVNQGLSNFSVYWSKEPKRHWQLKQQAIHHNQVSHCHISCTIDKNHKVLTLNLVLCFSGIWPHNTGYF